MSIRNPSGENRHRLLLWMGLAGIALTLLCLWRDSDGALWASFIFNNGNDKFMDFMNHIQYCADRNEVYYVSGHANFPPLAYCFYYFLHRILPPDSIVNWNASATGPYAYLIYVIYSAILTAALYELIRRFLKGYSSIYIYLLSIQILLSYSFVSGVFERGNSAYIVLVLLLAALLLREEAEPWKRELALVLIAVAAGFKLYPAVIGLLYLAEKRYKEALRLIVYGLLLFFLPFMFFGGFAGFLAFLANQRFAQGLYSFFTVPSILRKISDAVGLVGGYRLAVMAALYAVALSFLIWAVFSTKKLYLRLGFLASMMVLFPSWSGSYTVVYFVLPLLAFLRDEQDRMPLAYALEGSFALIFTLFAVSARPLFAGAAIAGLLPILGSYLVLLFCSAIFISDRLAKGR